MIEVKALSRVSSYVATPTVIPTPWVLTGSCQMENKQTVVLAGRAEIYRKEYPGGVLYSDSPFKCRADYVILSQCHFVNEKLSRTFGIQDQSFYKSNPLRLKR